MFKHQTGHDIRVQFLDLHRMLDIRFVVIQEDRSYIIAKSAQKGEDSFQRLPPESQRISLPDSTVTYQSPSCFLEASREP